VALAALRQAGCPLVGWLLLAEARTGIGVATAVAAIALVGADAAPAGERQQAAEGAPPSTLSTSRRERAAASARASLSIWS
jgi:hypothetical protein